jgi:hypothetical protein
LATADAWVYAQLNAQAALAGKVRNGPGPSAVTTPLVVYHVLRASDVRTVNGARIMTTIEYLVRAIGVTRDYADVEAMAAAIDTALHKRSSGAVLACVRTRPFQSVGAVNGQESRERGGYYAIHVQG